eukprot:gnl/MRDRNA2_/MRDRNA2_34394_c0_seq1.p1 gnl/MRDRNA2_/MRDRNA2_34394_c0~~gnl/MRDRNA2_/MRDRNA2_34394_c0_seq1.p1  ORF type:complete len:453 (-),score=61.52 gnl/MRDRNA2_/MRDRNA2_34394_c0_seq1:77-1435(-)
MAEFLLSKPLLVEAASTSISRKIRRLFCLLIALGFGFSCLVLCIPHLNGLRHALLQPATTMLSLPHVIAPQHQYHSLPLLSPRSSVQQMHKAVAFSKTPVLTRSLNFQVPTYPASTLLRSTVVRQSSADVDPGATVPASRIPVQQYSVTIRKPMGIVLEEVPKNNELKCNLGAVYVAEVLPDSNAEKAGVLVGDVLTSCSCIELKAGKEGEYASKGHGGRPFENFERGTFPTKGQTFDTTMAALGSNNERWGFFDIDMTFSRTMNPIATLDTTMGSMKVELFLDQTPITVSNFVDLASKGFYDGIHFHRVIPGFMDQFGCPFARELQSPHIGKGGPQPDTSFENLITGESISRDGNGKIPDEFIAKISNQPGTLSMANTGMRNSGGSQFFINVADNTRLDWFDKTTPSKHPVFGKVIENFDVAVQISNVATQQDRPLTPIMMKSIKVEFPSA